MKSDRFHSLYPQNPPELIIEPKNSEDYFEEMVSEHLMEEYYENDTSFGEIDKKMFSELIKWEKL